MQMIDVLQKLREIAAKSPEEISRAIAAAEAMSGKTVAEAKAEKPDYIDLDKDGDKKESMAKAAKDAKSKKEVKEDDDAIARINAVASDLKAMAQPKEPPKMPNVNDIPADSPAAMFKTEAAKEPGAVATAKVMDMGGKYVTADGKHLTDAGKEKRDEIIRAIEREQKESVNEDVQITLTGSDAVLAEILKLAGQIGAKTSKGPEPVVPAGPPSPIGVPTSGPLPSLDKMLGHDAHDEPMLDGSYDASTTPDETIMDLDAAIPAGDDLNKPKITAPKVSKGDNPLQSAISFR